MKLATIDIGSNSIHLLIVDVDQDGHFRALDREREMVRLGANSLTARHLSPDAVERAITALVRYADLAKAHGCSKIIATATSAVREADNGDRFLKRVRRATGIEVELLNGSEEARLIALAVNYVRDLGGRRTLGVDIGGGSTEFWILEGDENRYLVSNRLGSVRLSDGFIHTDPISKKELERLRGYIIGTLARTSREVAEFGFERVILTSGTALTLAQMAYAMNHGGIDTADLPPQDTEGLELNARDLRKIRKLVTTRPLRERARIPGLPPERADIIVAGAILLDTIYQELNIETAFTCDWSLREGVFINYLENTLGHARTPNRGAGDYEMNEIRRRSVLSLARRFGFDEQHARQTARLAKSLFDQTQSLHGMGKQERELLEAAAVLHDIGYAISHAAHNLHAQYLIENSEMVGFSSRELAIVSAVVRYHRGNPPRAKHREFMRLLRRDRRIVSELTALLRVADALDRSSRSAVAAVAVEIAKKQVSLIVTPAADCHLEMWDAERKAPMFEDVFGRKVRLQLVETPVPVVEEQAAPRRAGRTDAPAQAG
jgi:exopolyphosphatase/guanosine-5'-triphosphate,3'-diphosphate pyrophosphatase